MAYTKTIKISEDTHEALSRLKEETGVEDYNSIVAVLTGYYDGN